MRYNAIGPNKNPVHRRPCATRLQAEQQLYVWVSEAADRAELRHLCTIVEVTDEPLHSALYRRRDDGDWDLMFAVGLDVDPATNLFEVGKDHFGGEDEEFMVIGEDSLADFPDVYEKGSVELFEPLETALPHSEQWPESIEILDVDAAGGSTAFVTIDGAETQLIVPNNYIDERTIIVLTATKDVFVLRDRGNGWCVVIASTGPINGQFGELE